MKRKNLFLIPALFLISTLCLITVSCFSGFQEKGEVTVTFSESTLRHIMARGADISEEQEDFDLSDLIPDSEEYKDFIALYQIMQNKPMEIFAGSTKSSILSAEDVTCALMIYESGDYLLISREASETMSEIKPGNLEEISSMMRFSTGLFISKGKYTENEGTIYINEEAYYDSSTKEWIKLESASRIGDVPTNNTYFTVLSNSGIRYYFVSEDYFGDDWTDIPDVDPYEDEQADSATLLVRLVVGTIAYEKTFTVYSNTKKAHVEFTDLPVGVTAKVIALVYFDDPDEGRLTYAKGESDEFVINPGSNYAKIKLREYYGGDEPPSGVPEAIIEGKGLYDEHGGSNNRQYLLAFYRNGMYAVYEYDSIPKIVDIDDSDEILAVLESGLLISYGTYTSTNEKFKYTETVCYDFSNRTYKKGTASGDWTLPFETINFATGSGVMVTFYNNGTSENPDDNLTPPEGNLTEFFPGFTDGTSVNYILALYDSNEYSIYEFSDEFLKNAGQEFAFSSNSTIEEKNEIISRMLNYGTVIAFGSYFYSVDKNEKSIFNYDEKAYWDKDSKKFIASSFTGNSDITSGFYMKTGYGSGLMIMFGFYESGHENKQIYSGQTMLPEDFREQFNGGWLYFSVLSDGTYSIYGNNSDENGQYIGDKYFAKGTWQSLEAEGSSPSLQLIETEYYDFDSDGLVSGGNKVTVVDLSKTSFSYNSSTEIELEFSLNIQSSGYPFTFMINGFDKNDVTDLDGNECNVTLYAITDQTDMQFIKSTLASDELTDDEKAEVLVPIIERSINYSLTSFQPGVNYSSHEGAPVSEVLDDGTIKWSGSCYTPLSKGSIYGVLATVYFSQNFSSGYYEFAIGCADGLTLSSDSNEVELTVSAMDIPCKIHFYHDDDYDSQYTVTTAMSEIMMFDEKGTVRESVLNELFAAAESSVNALAEKGYEFDTNLNPKCGIQDGVPFVTLYFTPTQEEKSLQFAITLNDVPQKDGVDATWYIIYAVNDNEMLAKLRTHFSPGSISYQQIDSINAQLGLNETVINYSPVSDPNFTGYSVLSDGTVKFTGIKPDLSYEDGDTGNFLAIVYTVTGSERTFVSAGFLEGISLSVETVNNLNFSMLTPLDVSGSGNIVTDTRSVVISMNYDSDALYLNQGTFEFSAKYPDGSDLTEFDASRLTWSAEMLYKGKNINHYGEPYYEVEGNKLLIQKQIPLPSEGAYQIYVTAAIPLNEYGYNLNSAQTFNVTIPDRHIYNISDDEQPWQYATSLHNVVITGNVTAEDWNWHLSDEGYDHLLQVVFVKHKSTLESLTFNGTFTSPDIGNVIESPLYDQNYSSGIQFDRRVSLTFNGVATVGINLFNSVRNIEAVNFSTSGSTIGLNGFYEVYSLKSLDLTGVTSIGNSAFASTGLENITIPESVTYIDKGAFNSCSSLNTVEFAITEGWRYMVDNGTPQSKEVSNAEEMATTLKNNSDTIFFRE